MATMKETADKALHKVEVDIEGLTVTVDKRSLESYDLLMALGRMRDGDIVAIDEVLMRLFNERKDEVLNHLREDDGFLSYEHVAEICGKVLEEAGQKN